MNRGLMNATGVALALLLVFKLSYLLRLSQQPGRSEVPQLLSFAEPESKEAGSIHSEDDHLLDNENYKFSWRKIFHMPGPGADVQSGLWARYGCAGKAARDSCVLAIAALLVLE
jgi:hypothetical protein